LLISEWTYCSMFYMTVLLTVLHVVSPLIVRVVLMGFPYMYL